MANDEQLFASHMSRRGLLTATGVVGAGIAAAPLLGGTASAATVGAVAPAPLSSGGHPVLGGPAGDPTLTPAVNGLHLQFGSDAAREVVASWHTLQPVHGARVLLGGSD